MNLHSTFQSGAKYLLFLSIVACSNLSPNDSQRRATVRNLPCYQSLIEQINQDTQLVEKIIDIRDSRIRGKSDPITVKQAHRLINTSEFIEEFSAVWQRECGMLLAKTDDLAGIRYINKDVIIIEIDDFSRHTLVEKFSRDKTKEFHRLIITNKPFDRSSYSFVTAPLLWKDTLENGWVYEVTQSKGLY